MLYSFDMSDFRAKYLKYKAKYIGLRNLMSTDVLNIETHQSKNFLDLDQQIDIQHGSKPVSACIVPHAGSTYVKQIMDYVFSDIDVSKISDVVLLTTNHRDTSNHHLIAGSIRFGNKTISLKHITNSAFALFESDIEFFRSEHSYLSVLPYLHFIDRPVYIFSIGSATPDTISAIRQICSNSTLIIGNTDLLHCGPNYGNTCPDDIESYNAHTIQRIIKNKPDKLEPESMCGTPSIQTFMELTNNMMYTDHIYSSSDKMFEYQSQENSVGYVGILYIRKSYLSSLPRKLMDYIFEHNLQPQDRKSITRETVRIIEAFRRIHNPQISMRDVSGIFVTIEKDGQLRGCIGTFELIGDLLNTILDRTIQTAFNDSRFSMITKDEYESKSNPSSWHYKINFLGKPFAIEPNEIPSKLIVGLHGITAIFDNNRSATYLASVLPESFGVTQENLQTKIDEIIKSLRDKAGGSGELKGVELYECREEKEHIVDA